MGFNPQNKLILIVAPNAGQSLYPFQLSRKTSENMGTYLSYVAKKAKIVAKKPISIWAKLRIGKNFNIKKKSNQKLSKKPNTYIFGP